MALASFDDGIAEERKQRIVKNLAKSGNFCRAVKANLTMEEIEANKVEDFVLVMPLCNFSKLSICQQISCHYHSQCGCPMMITLKEKRKRNN